MTSGNASTGLDLDRLKRDRECGQALSGPEVDLLLAERRAQCRSRLT